jgi:PHD/YefM family antitoxin component YafN of YafNO toxin-antitoxin module
MAITPLSSREFNQNPGRAKKAAQDGPVFITDRGRATHVLMTVTEYQRLAGASTNIVDLLAMPEAAEIEFEVPRFRGITQTEGRPDAGRFLGKWLKCQPSD